jgi:chemotaxis protein MotB
MNMNKKILVSLAFIGLIPLLSGCSILDKARRADQSEREAAQLRSQLEDLKEEKDQELEMARRDLAKTLEKELGEYKAKLEMTERGLVITFLAEIFFDSGKDVLRLEGRPVLEKVAKILNKDVINSNIAIEGHTDTDPIKYSGWRSNWELSGGRAMAVLHYFIDACNIKPERLSANAYGEFRPVASNDAATGKQKNRRVEIVILPSELKKVKP